MNLNTLTLDELRAKAVAGNLPPNKLKVAKALVIKKEKQYANHTGSTWKRTPKPTKKEEIIYNGVKVSAYLVGRKYDKRTNNKYLRYRLASNNKIVHINIGKGVFSKF